MFGKLLDLIHRIFSPARYRALMQFLPVAIPIAEAIAKQDWNGDGAIATRQQVEAKVLHFLEELSGIAPLSPVVQAIPAPVRESVSRVFFHELFDEDGRVRRAVLGYMTDSALKRLSAVVGVVRTLLVTSGSVPAALTLGLAETVVQMAYERTKH